MSSRDLKGSGLTDRLAAAAEAKAALIAKMKPKATVTDPLFAERAAMREAELKAVREARAAEKAAAVQAKPRSPKSAAPARNASNSPRPRPSKSATPATRPARRDRTARQTGRDRLEAQSAHDSPSPRL